SMRVIADHARAAAFLISEGIFPGRDGRAYVLRRVMRRAIRHGHRLGIGESFLHHITARVVAHMGDVYPQLVERKELIVDVTRSEEERFRRTLARGLELLDENHDWIEAGGTKKLPGAVAFKLYDTYGFPLDLQEVIGRERGFGIDEEGFEAELETARKRSQGSKVGEAAVADVYPPLVQAHGLTDFLGYDTEEAEAKLLAIVGADGTRETLGAGEEGELVLDRTPFYAEKGGQTGDRGI